MRLENKGSNIQVANWSAMREKRNRFEGLKERDLAELHVDKRGMPVIPLVRPILKSEMPGIPWARLSGVSLFTITEKMGALSFGLPSGPIKSLGTCPAANLSKEAAIYRSAEVEREGGFADVAQATAIGHRGPKGVTSVPVAQVSGMFICDACYAGKANYKMYGNIHVSQKIRHLWTLRALKRGSFAQEMTSALRVALGHAKLPKTINPNFFRIHDSGEMESVPYMMGWFEVCANIPNVNFWAPTRMWVVPEFRAAFQHKPSNLTLRPSALFYGVNAPSVPFMSAGSTSAPHDMPQHQTCPAYKSGVLESCESVGCRTCWMNPEIPVNYSTH
jgi:hypothetical protein